MKELVLLTQNEFNQACLAAARITRDRAMQIHDNFLTMACRAGLDEAVGEAFVASRCFPGTTLDSAEIYLWGGEQMVQLSPNTLTVLQMIFSFNKSLYSSRSQYLDRLGTLGETYPDSSAATILRNVYQLALLVHGQGIVPEVADKARGLVSDMRSAFLSAVVCDKLDLLCAFAMVVHLLRHHLQAESLSQAVNLISVALLDRECTPEELQRSFNNELIVRGVDLSRFRRNFGLASSGISNKRRDKKKKSSRKRR